MITGSVGAAALALRTVGGSVVSYASDPKFFTWM